jgi:hypothetical protein
MRIPPTAPTNAPICNACHRPTWRNARATSQYIGNTPPEEGHLTVCVWCSAVWMIEDGKCVPLNEKQQAEVAGELAPVLKIFENNRRCAARLGLTLNEFLALADLAP